MDLGALVLSALLFVAFVPGVVAVIPSHSSRKTVLTVHAVLFAIMAGLVMTQYRSYVEGMSNYGDSCPNGYVEGPNQKGEMDCVPVGAKTYGIHTGLKSKTD
jgi:hypothetical protein